MPKKLSLLVMLAFFLYINSWNKNGDKKESKPATFKIIGKHYAKDKNDYYDLGVEIDCSE
jgi:hypothetical protein